MFGCHVPATHLPTPISPVLVEFLKQHPPLESALIQVVFASALVAWLFWRGASLALKRVLLVGVAGYWLLTTPLGAGALVAGLSYGLAPIQSREEARGADTIVLLGGGADTYTYGGVVIGAFTGGSAFRALEAARVYKLIGARTVIASGGNPEPWHERLPESQLLRDALTQAGVAPGDIVQESTSMTTRDQARLLRSILRARGAERFVLVTSPMHMRRALGAFRREGLDPIPSLAPLASDTEDAPALLVPSDQSRYLSDLALYDYAAGIYYWWLDRRADGGSGH